VQGNPLIRDPSGIVAGYSALVGSDVTQPPEAMQPACELYRRQFQLKGRLLPSIENPAGKLIATVENFFGDKGINRSEVGRGDDNTIDTETASSSQSRRQERRRLPQLSPRFSKVKRNQSGAVIDSHSGSCNRILMIQPFRLAGHFEPKKTRIFRRTILD
jgi:hypothetical protein